MVGHFSEIKRLLPGIILGLVFVGAFGLGLYGFGGSNPVASNPTPLANGVDISIPTQAAQGAGVISTQTPSPATEVVQTVPTSEPPTLEPVVAQETTQTPQLVPAKKQSEESEKRVRGKEGKYEEDDDD